MGVSEGHRRLTEAEFVALSSELDGAWTDPDMARQQRELADRELLNWSQGREIAPFRAYVNLLHAYCWDATPLLDVGCGAGYYAALLRAEKWLGQYCGIDYSHAMVEIASEREPHASFRWGDARELPCADRSYPVVVSGCVVLHVASGGGWKRAMEEAARVSSEWLMLHRTPLVPGREHRYWRKLAYGKPCLEIHFGADALRETWDALGFTEQGSVPTSTGEDGLQWRSIMLRRRGP